MKTDFKKEKLFKKNNGVAQESKERKGARCPAQVCSEAAVWLCVLCLMQQDPLAAAVCHHHLIQDECLTIT